MKFVFWAVCVLIVSTLHAPVLLASNAEDNRADADQYYLGQDFKKAFKLYYKLAKTGDHYSQSRVSQIYANGEGKPVDLQEAYAWAVLAVESGDEKLLDGSDMLLQRIDDKTGAQKRATKLMSKYGEAALKLKARKQARRDSYKRSGACTGSRLACARG